MPNTWDVGVPERTQNLLQLHDCRIGSHPLMDRVVLARVAGIEDFGILVVVVRHGVWIAIVSSH